MAGWHNNFEHFSTNFAFSLFAVVVPALAFSLSRSNTGEHSLGVSVLCCRFACDNDKVVGKVNSSSKQTCTFTLTDRWCALMPSWVAVAVAQLMQFWWRILVVKAHKMLTKSVHFLLVEGVFKLLWIWASTLKKLRFFGLLFSWLVSGCCSLSDCW